MEDTGQDLVGVMRVFVERCNGVIDPDYIVTAELNYARNRWMISDELAEEFWSAWRGTGGEQMEYRMSDDSPDDRFRLGHRH